MQVDNQHTNQATADSAMESSANQQQKQKPSRKGSQPKSKGIGGKKSPRKTQSAKKKTRTAHMAKFPRHPLIKALRVPRAILEQNAGQACAEREAAKFAAVGYGGPFRVEVSSAKKYGLMERPEKGQVAITERARQILRPQSPEDKREGLRQAVLSAPDIGEVYHHYRGENLPDPQFFRNALVDKFKIPEDKVSEFESIFFETMKDADLLEEHGDKKRLLNVMQETTSVASDERLRKLGREVSIKSTDTCFVVMPFADPIGGYYSMIYEPAIKKAGLSPVRADADIFGTGKIIDQIWQGINSATVLVAELTGRNPNVFYELGLAHALDKPVVLVCSNEADVPFDLQHIRVIYYDMSDPFWGSKLIDKIGENILSAIRNPEEAVFKSALDSNGASTTAID